MRRLGVLSRQLLAAQVVEAGSPSAEDLGGGSLWTEKIGAAPPMDSLDDLVKHYAAPKDGMELCGLNHIALVCSDMAKNVRFFGDVLGLPLIKTLSIPGGGQHFFWDMGNGAALAYFYFPEAPAAVDGLSRAGQGFRTGKPISTSIGSMNHLAFGVENEEKLLEYRQRLLDNNIWVSKPVFHTSHEPGPDQWKFPDKGDDPRVILKSIYFYGPDGEMLEFSTTARELGGARDLKHVPAGAAVLRDHAPPPPQDDPPAWASWETGEAGRRPPAKELTELVERYQEGGTATKDGMQLTGLNHLALVCSDMAKTTRFFGDVMGLKLVKTLPLPGKGGGQHLFFDVGQGAMLAYIWDPKAVKAVDGVSRVSADAFRQGKDIFTAIGSGNHYAFAVENEAKLLEYRQRLKDKGVWVSKPVYHADNKAAVAASGDDPKVVFKSIYFFGPDGEMLELSVTNRKLGGAKDIRHMPAGPTAAA